MSPEADPVLREIAMRVEASPGGSSQVLRQMREAENQNSTMLFRLRQSRVLVCDMDGKIGIVGTSGRRMQSLSIATPFGIDWS